MNQQVYLQTVNVPQAWAIETGSSGVKIGIISPGGVFGGHEDLSSRVTLKYQGATQNQPVPP
ncbi:MAG: hypothetical protein LC662_13750 [Rhodothermaceae bacterium]|nr:hypothetical protein [Rhodothermaceae bacterium]